MAKPNNKSELLLAASGQWERMWELIGSLPGGAEAVTFDFPDDPRLKEAHWRRDKNLRDVLVHLYEWHRLLLQWVAANMAGDARPFLPEPYNWKTYGEMNVGFWSQHQSTTYDEAEAMLRASHAQVMELMEGLSDEELFAKRHFAWTGTSNVGSYCASATASHYDWAMRKLRRHLRG